MRKFNKRSNQIIKTEKIHILNYTSDTILQYKRKLEKLCLILTSGITPDNVFCTKII